jgi:hypothetical protein
MKTTKMTKKTENQVVTNNTDGINWNAKYYREKAAKFFESASYSAPSKPLVIDMKKREKKTLVKTGLAAALTVRHNKAASVQKEAKSVVLIAGVPHKMRDGKLVPMIPAKDSKKWDVIEA